MCPPPSSLHQRYILLYSTGNRSRRFPRVFLPNPHLKVGAILGATGCWKMRHAGGSSTSVRLDMPPLPQSSSVPSVRRRPFRFSLRDATAQLFCGGSVSAQFGRMKRSFLDFSSILAQLEVRIYPCLVDKTYRFPCLPTPYLIKSKIRIIVSANDPCIYRFACC